jgi:hypothetical protein
VARAERGRAAGDRNRARDDGRPLPDAEGRAVRGGVRGVRGGSDLDFSATGLRRGRSGPIPGPPRRTIAENSRSDPPCGGSAATAAGSRVLWLVLKEVALLAGYLPARRATGHQPDRGVASGLAVSAALVVKACCRDADHRGVAATQFTRRAPAVRSSPRVSSVMPCTHRVPAAFCRLVYWCGSERRFPTSRLGRFVMVRSDPDSTLRRLMIVQNWPALLR